MTSRVILTVVATLCVCVVIASENPDCTTTVDADKPATLVCPLTGEIKWSREDGTAVETVEKKFLVDSTNRSLTILKVGKETCGKFVCKSSESENVTQTTLTVCVLPHVAQYDKPKNVIEGDPFQTECDSWGYPPVTVEWSHDKNFTGALERLLYKNGSSMNSILRIEQMQYEDSGYYTCVAKNSVGAKNATIEVNVKDKLAALWPFLGICAEVAILCVIIFFYERRRAKNLEKEAQSEETDHMTANNDNKVSEDVRHRK